MLTGRFIRFRTLAGLAVIGLVVTGITGCGHPSPRTRPPVPSSSAFPECTAKPLHATDHAVTCDVVDDGAFAFSVTRVVGHIHRVGTDRDHVLALAPNQYIGVYLTVTNISSKVEEFSPADQRGHDSAGHSEGTPDLVDIDNDATFTLAPGRTLDLEFYYALPDTVHLTWIELHAAPKSAGARVWLG